jgi:EAL and modified HD-GYP domain-containing signal transduction protein
MSMTAPNASGNIKAYVPIFVARQPVFDREQKVWGYEVFSRHHVQGKQQQSDNPDIATAEMIADGVSLVLSGLEENRKLLINISSTLLRSEILLALPADTCFLDISVRKPAPELTEACARLAQAGYKFSIDLPAPGSLVKMATVVKLDALRISPADAGKIINHLSQLNCLLLGARIENEETYKQYLALGIHLFNGPYFCKPIIVPGRKLSATSTAKLKLVNELSSESFDPIALSKILARDPALSYRLLNFINSANFAFRNSITSIKQAIMLLGHLPLKHWLMAAMLSDTGLDARQTELYAMSVQRGRFLELLAEKSPRLSPRKESMMLLGLFSMLDALLGQPMEDIVGAMALDNEVKGALCGLNVPDRKWLLLTESVQHGQWDEVSAILSAHALKINDAAICYNMASLWATEVMKSIAKSS